LPSLPFLSQPCSYSFFLKGLTPFVFLFFSDRDIHSFAVSVDFAMTSVPPPSLFNFRRCINHVQRTLVLHRFRVAVPLGRRIFFFRFLSFETLSFISPTPFLSQGRFILVYSCVDVTPLTRSFSPFPRTDREIFSFPSPSLLVVALSLVPSLFRVCSQHPISFECSTKRTRIQSFPSQSPLLEMTLSFHQPRRKPAGRVTSCGPGPDHDFFFRVFGNG